MPFFNPKSTLYQLPRPSGLDSGPEPFEDLVPVFLGLRLEDLADPLAASRDIHRVAP